jgi:hypothetical protein
MLSHSTHDTQRIFRERLAEHLLGLAFQRVHVGTSFWRVPVQLGCPNRARETQYKTNEPRAPIHRATLPRLVVLIRSQNLCRGAFRRFQRAFHVALVICRSFCTGPMDAPARLA